MASSDGGAATFGMSDPGDSSIGTASEPAARPAQVQEQSASAVNLRTDTSAGGRVASVGEPEQVPISSLARLNYVGPKYPRAARRRNITGSVDLTFTVTTDGRVRSISVLRSEPAETFDEAAVEAVEQWRFKPVIENGVAVEKRTAVRLAFDLE
jgi:TonB family protein